MRKNLIIRRFASKKTALMGPVIINYVINVHLSMLPLPFTMICPRLWITYLAWSLIASKEAEGQSQHNVLRSECMRKNGERYDHFS